MIGYLNGMTRPLGPRGRLTKSVLVKLTDGQREALQAAALLYEVTAPELLRQALDDHLGRRKGEVAPVLDAMRKARRRSARRAMPN